MHIPQTMQVASPSGTVEVTKKDPVEGPSAEWEAMFPGGKRKSFYGAPGEVKLAVEHEIWRTM
jgi:hypothetical protein